MRTERLSWHSISERLGKKSSTCRMHWVKLQQVVAKQEWSDEADEALKNAYKRKKGDMWSMLATEMGFQGNWRVMESRVFELGKKGLK